MKTQFFLGVAALSLTSMAFASGGDPSIALKAIVDYRTSELAKARAAGTAFDAAKFNAKVKEMAAEAVTGVDSASIEPAQGLDYAQLYQYADMPREASRAAERYVGVAADPMKKYLAQSIMLSSNNQLADGGKLIEILKTITPPNNVSLYSLASFVANMYSDTIRATVSVDAALAALRLTEANVRLATPANDNEMARSKLAISALTTSGVELLADAHRTEDALAVLASAMDGLDSNAAEYRSLNGLKTRITLVGAAAPELAFERSHGEFKGLESLRGKVVIVDFFAHWCGPCIRSFPDMMKLYEDLKPKGLEVVGFTTYYGYYKKENSEKRDMPKDVEFAKMAEFIAEHKLPWPVVYGERTNFNAYGVTGIPHVVVIDRNGKVHKIKVGYSPDSFAAFRLEIEKLLS